PVSNRDQISKRRPAWTASLEAPDNLDMKVPDLLAQRIAVEPQELGGAKLVALGRQKGEFDQRPFDFAQNAVIEPSGRQGVVVRIEIIAQVPFHRLAQRLVGRGARARGDLIDLRLGKLGADFLYAQGFLGIKRAQAPDQILKLAHVSRPAV